MHAKLVRVLLSGVLVLPVCLTGIVTAFQFQESRVAVGVDSSLLRTNVGATVADVTSDEEAPATQSESTALAAIQNETNTEEVPDAVPAAPAPGDATPDAAKQLIQAQVANREYFARLTTDGLIPGRLQFVDGRSRGLVAARKVTISFVQSGKVISQARPGIDGYFQAAGLQPGYYSVVASGADGMLTFGVEIQPALSTVNGPRGTGRVKEDVQMQIETDRFRLRQTESDDVRDAESFLRIDAVLVPPRDIPVVKQLLQPYLATRRNSRYLAPRGRYLGPMATATTRSVAPRTPPARMINAEKTTDSSIKGSWGTSLRLPTFYQHSDGVIGGRVTKFAPDMVNRDVHFRIPLASASVYLVRNGAVVEQAGSDQHGRFRISGTRVGDYTFVAASPMGIAAFGVSIMPHAAESADRSPGAPVRSVSSIRLVQNGGDTGMSDQDVDIDTADPNDLNIFDEYVEEQNGGGGALGGGAGGGGGGGGFGGGGGLGLLGLGGLAGLAGLNNNNSSTSSGGGGGGGPASPPGP